MKRQIDILFATYNGARTLPLMLDALSRLQAPERPWRILAVNNRSDDQTADLLAGWSARLPIEISEGPGTGKVPALTLAARKLEGDLVVLTDDDILPEPGWLRALEAAADAHPETSIFGGAIQPVPIDELGPWYDASEDYALDLFGRTRDVSGPVNGADVIFGPNMMMRREAALAALTDPAPLGPSPAGRSGKRIFPLGDESEMIDRLEKAGVLSRFVPEACVGHMVRAFQTDLGFMLQRAQNHGRGVALRAIGPASNYPARLRIVTGSAFKAGWIWPRAVLADRSRPDRETFNTLYGLNWHAGRIKGALSGPFSSRKRPPAAG